jgi:hypothetical protein
MVTEWDHFYFCTTPVDKLAAVVANQRNCGEQITYDSRVLRVVVQLVDANTAVATATPTVVKAMAGITRPKKFRLSSLDDLQRVRRRLLKRDRAPDAKVVSIFMGLVSKVGHLHHEVRKKQKELGILNNISSRQTARVVKGKADAICE